MKRLIRQFMQREAHPVIQFIKYGMAGGIATAVDIAVFFSMCLWVLPAIGQGDLITKVFPIQPPEITEAVRANRFVINTIVAFLFSNLTAYIINIAWVFHPGKHKWYIEMGLFYMVSGISIFVGTGIGWLAITFIGLGTTYTFITKAVASLLINYVCRKFIIFNG